MNPVWVVVGLLVWALLVFAWTNSPDVCSLAVARSSEHCQRR